MNVKKLLAVVIGSIVFFSVWIYNMIGGISLLIGFGAGIMLHSWFTGIFKNWQKGIYLTEKRDMQHRKVELEAELKQLKEET